MTSPYLSRLLTAIQAAISDEERLSLRAEYAGALARYGAYEQATREIEALRKANSSYAPAVTCWILIADGQLAHFTALAPAALGSFRGATALARGLGRDDIAAIAGAWMAASEYVAGDVPSAARHAIEALNAAPRNSLSCFSRAHLVIADCLSCAGLPVAASDHYRLARTLASDDGDISMQSVVLFNAAAFAVSRLTLRECQGDDVREDLRTVELQLASIANLDSGIGLASLSALVPLLQAEWMLVAKRWNEAADRYSKAIGSASHQGQERWFAKYRAELALCYAQAGAVDLALDEASRAISQLNECTDSDTRGIAHTRLSQAFGIVGKHDLCLTHKTQALSELRRHRDEQRTLEHDLKDIMLELKERNPAGAGSR